MMKSDFAGAKILIVDDSQESVELLEFFLKPKDYKIHSVASASEGLAEIEGFQPDLILLDAVLPGMSGYELCTKIKNNPETFHIPVVMITALKELQAKIQATEAGADDFISKPFDSLALLARVRSLLRVKYYHDELVERNHELEEQKRQLQEEDRLKEELTRMIVHDMKNPISVIQGNLNLMQMLQNNGDEVQLDVYAQRIERNSRGLLRMILNLLDISRLKRSTHKLTPSPLDMNEAVSELIRYFTDNSPHGEMECTVSLMPELPFASVSGDLFNRVLDNLFNFVFQNTTDDTHIEITSSLTPQGRIQLYIFSNGMKLKSDVHHKLFSRKGQRELRQNGFRTARGLGLVFCRLATEQLGGSLRLDPLVTEGIAFVVELPPWAQTVRLRKASSDNEGRSLELSELMVEEEKN